MNIALLILKAITEVGLPMVREILRLGQTIKDRDPTLEEWLAVLNMPVKTYDEYVKGDDK